MRAIVNASLILETGILFNGVLLMDGGRIADFGPASALELPAGVERIDAGGLYVGPGFVDIHCHGGGGAMFGVDPKTAARHYLRHGETTILATLHSQLGYEEMLESIARIQSAMDDTFEGRAIGGIYMEGPFMNPKYGASAQDNQWKGLIHMERARAVIRQGGKSVKVWAVAPEREGIEELVRAAREENPDAVFAVGHSEAAPAQVFALKKYGLRLQTHCTNATSSLSDMKGTRGCGPDEACFYDSDMYAELICDSCGIHVHPDMLRLIAKIKGEDKMILISDGFVSEEQSPEHLRHITDLMFDSNGDLSGSKLTMEVACRNMMSHTSLGLCQVFKLASLNPARALGLDGELGSLQKGKRANLVLVNDRVNVFKVFLDGEAVPDNL